MVYFYIHLARLALRPIRAAAERILEPESQKSINPRTPRSRRRTADAPDEFNGFSRISVDVGTCTGHAIAKHTSRARLMLLIANINHAFEEFRY